MIAKIGNYIQLVVLRWFAGAVGIVVVVGGFFLLIKLLTLMLDYISIGTFGLILFGFGIPYMVGKIFGN